MSSIYNSNTTFDGPLPNNVMADIKLQKYKMHKLNDSPETRATVTN